MSAALLDVNVLVALFDPAHIHHEDAHEWFGANRNTGWATCPITINGCVRVLSHPSYATVEATPEDVIHRLADLCGSADHEFWEGSVSLLDERLFHRRKIAGHRKITDAYLLALAVSRNGRLATFDQSIPRQAVVGALPTHVELLGGASA